jgi:hypothetical protein
MPNYPIIANTAGGTALDAFEKARQTLAFLMHAFSTSALSTPALSSPALSIINRIDETRKAIINSLADFPDNRDLAKFVNETADEMIDNLRQGYVALSTAKGRYAILSGGVHIHDETNMRYKVWNDYKDFTAEDLSCMLDIEDKLRDVIIRESLIKGVNIIDVYLQGRQIDFKPNLTGISFTSPCNSGHRRPEALSNLCSGWGL